MVSFRRPCLRRGVQERGLPPPYFMFDKIIFVSYNASVLTKTKENIINVNSCPMKTIDGYFVRNAVERFSGTAIIEEVANDELKNGSLLITTVRQAKDYAEDTTVSMMFAKTSCPEACPGILCGKNR